MAKKHTEETMTPEQEAAMIAARDASRPLAGQSNVPMDREVASHQWQAGSAAVDTNVLSEHLANGVQFNALEAAETEEKMQAKEEAQKAVQDALEAQYEYEDGAIDPSRRDVSDPLYAQPGSERHKAYLAKKAKHK